MRSKCEDYYILLLLKNNLKKKLIFNLAIETKIWSQGYLHSDNECIYCV